MIKYLQSLKNRIGAQRKELRKYVILLFALYLLSIFAGIAPTLFPYQGVGASLFRYFAFIFVILHALETLGKQKTVMFFIVALLFGFLSEYLGAVHGLVFGKYVYNEYTNMILGAVPWQTPLSWSVITYICYCTTNLFLKGFGGRKPNFKNALWYPFCLLLLLSSLDGIAAMNIDMVLDPCCVNCPTPSWTWAEHGAYFGIPISNFIGWFMVTFFTTLIFRTYESFKEDFESDKMGLLNFAPTIVYGTYTIRYVNTSLQCGHVEYTLIGIATMMPFILVTAILALITLRKCRLEANDEYKKISKIFKFP